ncbi:MAG: Uma2 family endonuclease [Acidobacteria bacterium]|nr:Uma2 family endonuclease [Acidobacteriota bacterium]
MSQPLLEISIDNLVIEDDEPVDNILSEKNQRLLTEPLYASWAGPGESRSYLAAANVGVFSSVHQSPIVPDMFLSLDVELPENWTEKRYQSYFVWEYDKPPDLAIEIVSNKDGKENTSKMQRYARIGITYYVIFDPHKYLSNEVLTIYGLQLGRYVRLNQTFFPDIGLGLCLWTGVFEGTESTWLRWCDRQERIIPTGKEAAETEKQRAEKLAAKLRELGIDPESL